MAKTTLQAIEDGDKRGDQLVKVIAERTGLSPTSIVERLHWLTIGMPVDDIYG